MLSEDSHTSVSKVGRTGVIVISMTWGRVTTVCSLWGNDFISFDVLVLGGCKMYRCVTHSSWEDSPRDTRDVKRSWNLFYCNTNTYPLIGSRCNFSAVVCCSWFATRLEWGTSHGICPGTTNLVMGSLHGETFWVGCGWVSFGKTGRGRGNVWFRVTEGIVTARFMLYVMYCCILYPTLDAKTDLLTGLIGGKQDWKWPGFATGFGNVCQVSTLTTMWNLMQCVNIYVYSCMWTILMCRLGHKSQYLLSMWFIMNQ